jgi:hypothetical protein
MLLILNTKKREKYKMKKPIRNALLGVLSTTQGMYMMAVPLATTVYANGYEAPARYNQMNSEYENQNPVKVVKASANEMGFDVNNDIFTLESEGAATAVVNVVHGDTSYTVTLERSHRQWDVNHENGRDRQQDANHENSRDRQQDANHENGRDQQQDVDQGNGRDRQQDVNHENDLDRHQDVDRETGRNYQQYVDQEMGQWMITSVSKD